MQYTVRNIPPALDDALRKRATAAGTSLNEASIEAMARGVGLSGRELRYRDLSDLSESWVEDREFDEAVADQDRVEDELWR